MDNSLLIKLKTEIIVQPKDCRDDFYDDYVRYYKGTIYILNEDETESEIGEVEFRIIDGSRAFNNHINIIELCDSYTQDEYDYAKSIYKDGMINEELIEMTLSQNVLALHTLAILPEYRGHGYGLCIAEKIFESFGSHCAAMVLKPMPLQLTSLNSDENWNQKYQLNAFSLSEDEALKKVTQYWKKLGLKKTRDPRILFKANM